MRRKEEANSYTQMGKKETNKINTDNINDKWMWDDRGKKKTNHTKKKFDQLFVKLIRMVIETVPRRNVIKIHEFKKEKHWEKEKKNVRRN